LPDEIEESFESQIDIKMCGMMNFVMDMDEQIFRLSEGAMGFHCNLGKEVATEWEQL
jgi:hypothetical protein